MSPMFITLVLVGIVYLFAGIVMRMRPPKKINPVYGYRTKLSMSSQEAWDKGQQISARYMILAGLAFLALSPIGFVFDLNEGLEIGLSLFLLILVSVLMLQQSHRELKARLNIDEDVSGE